MSSSASVKLRYEKCLQVWGNANFTLSFKGTQTLIMNSIVTFTLLVIGCVGYLKACSLSTAILERTTQNYRLHPLS